MYSNIKKGNVSLMKIDHGTIKNLAELLKETDLSEIEISEGDKSIRVARNMSVNAVATTIAAAPVLDAPGAKAPEECAVVSYDNHPGATKSPMVGTVYLQSDPDSPAFISKGAKVKAGDTLLIVEAMKVMNPIKAEKGGTVIEILVDDAQPIEFGQILVIIE